MSVARTISITLWRKTLYVSRSRPVSTQKFQSGRRFSHNLLSLLSNWCCEFSFTFEYIDAIVLQRQFEGQCRVMGFEDAKIIVQNSQLAAGVAQEAAGKQTEAR